MAMRITGMNSGLDTEKIIAEMVSGHKTKVDTAKKNQVALEWKQDAWKALNTKALKLFKGTLNNMRFTDAYSKKVTKVSNENAVSVVTGASASQGVQDLQVKQLAKAGYLTGAELGGSVTKDTTLNKLAGIGADQDVSFSVKTNGKTTDIALKGSSTISDVLTQLKNAGVNANFDEANQRFFISSKATGAAAEFSLMATDDNGFAALSAMGVNLKDEYESIANMTATEQNKWIKERELQLQGQIDALDKSVETKEKQVEAFEDTMVSGYKSLLKSTYGFSDAQLELLQPEEVIMATKTKVAGTQDETVNGTGGWRDVLKADVNRDPADVENMTDEEVAAEYKKAIQDGRKVLEEALKSDPNNQGLKDDLQELDSEMAHINAYESRNTIVKDIGIYDGLNADINTNDPAKRADLVNQKANAATEVADRIAAAEAILNDSSKNNSYSDEATRISGQDAKVTLNDAEFNSADNVFEINGLTITANKETAAGEKITLTTQNDTEGVYDMVKGFLKEYNELINEMDKLYNAPSSGGYQPLTAEEKEAMTEEDIKKWEGKIKDGLLRRDSILQTVSSNMKQVMMGGIEVNGKKMHLSTFGIETLSYFESADNEKNAYHIDGDADDEYTGHEDDILKGMIASDPNAVTNFFMGLSKNLYGEMDRMMRAGAPSDSSLTSFYDDKKMKRDYDGFTGRIKELEKKMHDAEDKYYRQFSAMEVALAKMQSKQSALTGMFGG